MRILLVALLLAACDRFPLGAVSYQLSCESVVCAEPQIEESTDDYQSCGWCQSKFKAEFAVFRKKDGCWFLERQYLAGETAHCF